MAAQTLYPIWEKVVSDGSKHYRIVRLEVPTTDNNHEVTLGEGGITDACQIEGVGTLTFTAPSGTSETGGIGSSDQSKRVTIATTSAAGKYTICVLHQGRNTSL